MNKKTIFACEYCGLEFDNEANCEEHEKLTSRIIPWYQIRKSQKI